jgi:hypothetical protein
VRSDATADGEPIVRGTPDGPEPLRANLLDVKEQYDRQLKDLQEAYAKAMLE